MKRFNCARYSCISTHSALQDQAPRYSSTITHSVLQDHALHTSAMAHSVLHQYITDYAQETMPDTVTGTDTLCYTNMPHTECTPKYLHTHVLSHKTMLGKFVGNVLQNNQKNLGRSHVSRVKYIRCVNQIYVLRIDKSLV